MDWLPSKGSAQHTTSRTNAQLLGWPKNLTTGQNGARSPPTPARLSDRKASLPTPARISDRKAWPRRNNACFRLRPASPIEDTLNLYLQLFSDWRSRSRLGPTDRGRTLGEDQVTGGAGKVGHLSQPQYRGPYPIHLQYR